MIRDQKLNEVFSLLLITCNNENVHKVKSWKLLDVEFNQNLN